MKYLRKLWIGLFGQRVCFKVEYHYYPNKLNSEQEKAMNEAFEYMDKVFAKTEEVLQKAKNR
jgi:hypothetical protein